MNDLNRSVLFFKLISACIAVVPGLLILLNHLPIPPTFSKPLIVGLIEIACCFILVFAWINKKSVSKLTKKAFNRIVSISFIGFLFFVFFYITLLNYSVIDSPKWGKPMFVPLFGNMSNIKEGSFQKFYDTYGVDELTYLIESEYKTPLLISKIIIYLNFISIFISLTLTFTILWLKYETVLARLK